VSSAAETAPAAPGDEAGEINPQHRGTIGRDRNGPDLTLCPLSFTTARDLGRPAS